MSAKYSSSKKDKPPKRAVNIHWIHEEEFEMDLEELLSVLNGGSEWEGSLEQVDDMILQVLLDTLAEDYGSPINYLSYEAGILMGTDPEPIKDELTLTIEENT